MIIHSDSDEFPNEFRHWCSKWAQIRMQYMFDEEFLIIEGRKKTIVFGKFARRPTHLCQKFKKTLNGEDLRGWGLWFRPFFVLSFLVFDFLEVCPDFPPKVACQCLVHGVQRMSHSSRGWYVYFLSVSMLRLAIYPYAIALLRLWCCNLPSIDLEQSDPSWRRIWFVFASAERFKSLEKGLIWEGVQKASDNIQAMYVYTICM